jgi:hypothetical protein
MTFTAVSVLRIRYPRAFAAVAVAVLLLGSCDSGEGETPADPAAPPPRPSPVSDAPPPPPREEPALSPEEAIERACRPPVGPEVQSLVACGDVAEAYRRLMEENRSCSSDDDCHIVEGACAIGLGGCWYAVSRSVTYDDADRLTARYRELACNGAVCRCAAPPERAACVEAVCTAGSRGTRASSGR